MKVAWPPTERKLELCTRRGPLGSVVIRLQAAIVAVAGQCRPQRQRITDRRPVFRLLTPAAKLGNHGQQLLAGFKFGHESIKGRLRTGRVPKSACDGFGGWFFRGDRMSLKQNQLGTDDRRKHTRYQLRVPIQLSVTDRPTIQGLTIEISEGGFGAAIGASLGVGNRAAATPIGYNAMLAVVRWSRGRAYGFEFLELTSDQQQRIRDHCRKLPLHCSSLDF